MLQAMSEMDKLVSELKKLLPFKDTTAKGDIVFLASTEPQMFVYALVTGIEPDTARKESWWNVTMQVLAVPPREVVWTLREPQFTGMECFTFSGIEHFMKAVRFDSAPLPSSPDESESESDSTSPPRKGLRVVK